MTDKKETKELKEEDLNKVSGGTIVRPDESKTFSIDYAYRVLSVGDQVEVYRISDDCDLGYWPVIKKYKENGNKVIVAQNSSNQIFEMGNGKPYVFGFKADN